MAELMVVVVVDSELVGLLVDALGFCSGCCGF
jgi:hypothetical protein